MLNNYFDNFYDPGFYASPYEYERLRQREEMRRRRAAEMAYRRRLEEEARLRRQAELEYRRQLAEENERQKRAQERKYEQYLEQKRRKERRAAELEQLRREKALREDIGKALTDEKTYLIRGRDGRIYRVPSYLIDGIDRASDTSDERSSTMSETASVASAEMMDAPEIASTRVPVEQNETEKAPLKKSRNNKNPRRRKVTVIVEDASDSEYEQDELKSPWRNRRPSPGQWMEPIEYKM